MNNPRQYGLGSSTEYCTSPPRILEAGEITTCPNCEGKTCFPIEIDVRHPNLRGKDGVGTYVGCCACPWASPMVMRAR